MTDFERTPIQFRVMDEIQAAFEAALAMEGTASMSNSLPRTVLQSLDQALRQAPDR